VPSIWQEPFGIVTLEAMCSGRPVVASRVAGQMEIIRDGVNGLLAAPQSSLDIAKQVMMYHSDENLMRSITEYAAKDVRENYSWDTLVDRHYIPVIESIVTR